MFARCAIFLAVLFACASLVDLPEVSAAEVANLKEQLEGGLRTRRPVEFAFVARVVTLVEADKLPLSLVKSTFQWSRRKKPFPFPFFERAMRSRAARLGVTI